MAASAWACWRRTCPLRDLGKDAALTGRSLAALCGWPASKVSKLEYGRQAPSEQDIRDWCVACGFPSEIPDLISAVRSVEAQMIDWRRSLKGGTRARQRRNVSAYEKTTLWGSRTLRRRLNRGFRLRVRTG